LAKKKEAREKWKKQAKKVEEVKRAQDKMELQKNLIKVLKSNKTVPMYIVG